MYIYQLSAAYSGFYYISVSYFYFFYSYFFAFLAYFLVLSL